MNNFITGKYIIQGYYKSFQPNPINRQYYIENMEMIILLGE